MADVSVGVNLIGRDVSASDALKKVGKEAENTGSAFAKIKTIAAGVFSANLLENAGSDALNFAKESIGAYQSVGQEVINLQRYTGDSAEAMSKLRFAAEESGVGADTLAGALGRMSKAAATTAGEKKFEALGISVKDSNGQFKSASALFDEVAGKIAALPNGVEKTNAVLQIFGKSGMSLLPLLNQGAAGIAKFGAEAQKMGLVLNGDSLKGVQANVMAQREFHASVEGLQVQLGQYLYPALTAVMKGMADIVPIITTLLRPAFETIGKVVSDIVPFIQQIVQYIIDLGQRFEESGNKMGAFSLVGKTLGQVFNDIKAIFNDLFPVLKTVGDFIGTVLGPILGVVFVGALKAVSFAGATLKDTIGAVIDIFKGLWDIVKIVGDGIGKIFSAVIDGFKMEINGIIDLINGAIDLLDKIHIKLPSFLGGAEFGINIPKIPHLADGGIVSSPTVALIGEAGPEAVVPLSQGANALGGAGGMNVTINVAGSVIKQQDLVAQVRNDLAQLLRRKGAPVAALGL